MPLLTPENYRRRICSLADETINIAMAVSPDALVFINNTDYSPMISNNGHLSLILRLIPWAKIFIISMCAAWQSITKGITDCRAPQLADSGFCAVAFERF